MKKLKRKKALTRLLYHEKKAREKGYRVIAGIDEAGRGPLAGPLVAASCILKERKFKNRIDDSKLLTARQRENAFREIAGKAIYAVGIIDEKIIDKINIYKATVLAMETAVSNLEIKPSFLLIDGRLKLNLPHKKAYIIKGDSKSLSIACASIIAKVTRDRIMLKYDKKYPEYGFKRHKGYGTKEHFKALAKHGPSPIHRFSFNPIKASA